jgi:hypothetical protein
MSDSLDDEFNKFLAEVERLTIEHGDSADTDADGPKVVANSDNYKASPLLSESSSAADKRKKIHRKNKESVMQNANINQRAWTEFTKLDVSRTESNTSNDDSRQKISFKIQTSKSKSKKKTNAVNKDIRKENDKVLDKSTCQNGVKQDGDRNTDGISSHTLQFLYPCWTLVIDTSALVNDNGYGVERLIDLANHISHNRFKYQKQQANKQYTLANTMVEEPIKIILPYSVWNELEYQSKSDNSDLAFSARTVIRMLRDALQQNHNQPTVSERIEVDRVVQSQSLLQHQNSAKKFVPYDLASKPTNDDHIIACALAEQESWAAESEGSLSGGVVMITSDNNMTCKALSNGLKVFSPTDFHEYYLERMESLRQRSRR